VVNMMRSLMNLNRGMMIFVCLSGVVHRAQGQELLPVVRDFQSLRGLGLGVTPVAMSGLSQGESAVVNPAWIGQEGKKKQKGLVRGFWFPSLTVGANGTTRSLAQAYFSGQRPSQERLENFLKAAKNEQTPYGFLSLSPGMTFGPMDLGLFARTRVEGYVWQPVESNNSSMDVRASVERGARLSLSVPYKNTGVFLGASLRPTWRSDFYGYVELADPLVSEAAKDLRARFNESRGIPVDVSLVARLQKLRYKPTLGLKIDDFGDTRFKPSSSAHKALIQKSNVSFGLAGWMLQHRTLSAQCSLAGHHLNDGRVVMAERLGGGCEFHLFGQIENDVVSGAPVILRAGGQRDGLSYGLSWDMPFALIEFSSSAVRVDAPLNAGSAFGSRVDRRFFLRLTVDASQP